MVAIRGRRWKRASVAETEFLVVDLETTGLDPRRDQVVSMAWVPVIGTQVRLGLAGGGLVQPPAGTEMGPSATVHGLTDDAVAGAAPIHDVLAPLLEALAGRVLVAHHAPLELSFLREPVRRLTGARMRTAVVDTMAVQHRLELGPHGEVRPGRLRLDQARRGYGLPRYGAHLALTDAIATAELLLAQAAELEHRLGRTVTLADLGARRTR